MSGHVGVRNGVWFDPETGPATLKNNAFEGRDVGKADRDGKFWCRGCRS